jgi:hypothetical protein
VSKAEAVAQRMKDRRLRMRGRQDIGRGSFVPESMV